MSGKKNSTPTPITSHTHADTRPNIPTVEPRSFRRRAFIEIVDPWDAKDTIRAFLQGMENEALPLLRK